MASFVVQKLANAFGRFKQLSRRLIGPVGNTLFYWLRALRCYRHRKIEISNHDQESPFRIPFHALVIGINEYKATRITNLRGAASDADAVDEYLRTTLHVPAQQIVNLRDKDATRDTIMRELQTLGTRETIRKGDAILVFYAGYGASAVAPKGWAAESEKISLIVPHDGLIDAESGVHPIPDRTISALLHKISGQKGDNITMIFDCCYLGHRTKQPDLTPSRLVRGFELERDESIPPGLDESIWRDPSDGQAATLVRGFSHPERKSHVTLSACREGGIAQEVGSRGLFTRALLETLRAVSTEKITYSDLIRRIHNIPGQTAICDGHGTDRLIFNALASSTERTPYPLSLKDEKLVMDAGFLQGVSLDSEFLIHTHRNPTVSDEPVAIMAPKLVRASSADFMYSPSSPTHALDFSSSSSEYYASQTSNGKVAGLRLHVTPSEPESRRSILEALSKVSQPRSSGPAVLLVDDAAYADLSVLTSANEVHYAVHEPVITACGLSELRQSTKTETKAMYPVFRAAAHFFRFLRHSPTESRVRDLVDVAVYALETDEEGELGPDLRRPWITSGDNLYDAGFVNVVADDDTAYGIRVRNDSDTPLHVWAFYFDCSGLAIFEYYRPPAVGHGAEPSLPARGVLTIGYGAGGGLPYTFFLREGQDLDVGFIKLFISPEPIDFSSIEQRSPFKDPVARGKKKRSAEFEVGWDTFTVAVVQRKP